MRQNGMHAVRKSAYDRWSTLIAVPFSDIFRAWMNDKWVSGKSNLGVVEKS
jgi:hypothetical protein